MPVKKLHRYLFIITALILFAGLYSCQITERATHDRPGATASDSLAASTEGGLQLAAYRNSLSDLYSTQNHDMPAFFMESYDSDGSGNRDPFQGFRIQLISTRNVSMADSVAKSFRIWSDTTITGFTPETYTTFQQPHYRVHVGDFNNRQRAIEFSQLVKRKYPDAWVVHDRINPYLVPADTTQIGLKSANMDSN
ncbi:SPOR domain-containing protein [Aliifodinibius sp. S!AR15-10]|uniref:SPOR domain-containing protein n=1 Tax=Aliifodinibius sp. S!AR15-10 TaxID=2950437 RepID=UPI00287064BB|nr:SPOR domain-containing protein [Aliifodinibius sp. S!AR15-10]